MDFPDSTTDSATLAASQNAQAVFKGLKAASLGLSGEVIGNLAPLGNNETYLMAALRLFILQVLPDRVDVIRGQINRVPEPLRDDFIVLTPLFRERLSTNYDTYIDTVFTGSIAGNTLTVSAINYGNLDIGSVILGVNVLSNTVITTVLPGYKYTISKSQNLSSGKLAAGKAELLQPIKATVQIDVHGPNSADYAHVITTTFRDDYGVQIFNTFGYGITPLYTGTPKQIPFINGELQVEERWSIDAVLQANQTITLSQAFADALSIHLINLE